MILMPTFYGYEAETGDLCHPYGGVGESGVIGGESGSHGLVGGQMGAQIDTLSDTGQTYRTYSRHEGNP